MFSFLYDAKARQGRLGLKHEYTNASSICLWLPENSYLRIWIAITAQIYI